MSTDSAHSPTDAQLLHVYLGQQLDRTGDSLSLDEALTGFQEYYGQLRNLREKVRQAESSLGQGLGGELDVEALVDRVRRRLLEQGLVE